MDEATLAVLDELARAGREHEAHETRCSQRPLNLEQETAQLISILVWQGHYRRVLELGASNGYSTIWLKQLGIHPPKLAAEALVLTDNVLSHPDDVAAHLAMLAAQPGFAQVTVPVGKGLSVAYRASQSAGEGADR